MNKRYGLGLATEQLFFVCTCSGQLTGEIDIALLGWKLGGPAGLCCRGNASQLPPQLYNTAKKEKYKKELDPWTGCS